MPRISAASVAEHVARQEQAVFAAAIALFSERGYRNVTLTEIAAEVGLARNSLYRYFPTKAAILLRWYRDQIPRLAERSAAALQGEGSAADRIERWAAEQIDYARREDHAVIAALGHATDDLSEAEQAELASGHRVVMAPFHATLAEAGLSGPATIATAELIWAAVMAQAGRELRSGDDPEGRAVLRRCIAALVPT